MSEIWKCFFNAVTKIRLYELEIESNVRIFVKTKWILIRFLKAWQYFLSYYTIFCIVQIFWRALTFYTCCTHVECCSFIMPVMGRIDTRYASCLTMFCLSVISWDLFCRSGWRWWQWLSFHLSLRHFHTCWPSWHWPWA